MIPATSFINNFFRYQKYSETQKNSSSNCFGSVRPKSFDGKSWHPLSIFPSIIFHTRKFLEDRRVPLRKYSTLCEKKIFTENRDTGYLFINNFFRYQKYSETQKNSSSNCFGSVRPKSFDGKSWHPLSVFSSLYFHTRKFLEDRRDPLRKSWALWETKSNQQKIVLPHSFINERLRYPKLFETQKGSSR